MLVSYLALHILTSIVGETLHFKVELVHKFWELIFCSVQKLGTTWPELISREKTSEWVWTETHC